MINKLLILLLLSLTNVSSCFKLILGRFQSSIFYEIDASMTYQDRLCIKEAIEDINQYKYYTNSQVYTFNDCEFCDKIQYIPEYNTRSIGYSIINGNFNGDEWVKSNCNIFIKKDLHINTCVTVVIHEFLHCFGLNHSENKDSIMENHITVDSLNNNVIVENKHLMSYDDILGLIYKMNNLSI